MPYNNAVQCRALGEKKNLGCKKGDARRIECVQLLGRNVSTLWPHRSFSKTPVRPRCRGRHADLRRDRQSIQAHEGRHTRKFRTGHDRLRRLAAPSAWGCQGVQVLRKGRQSDRGGPLEKRSWLGRCACYWIGGDATGFPHSSRKPLFVGTGYLL